MRTPLSYLIINLLLIFSTSLAAQQPGFVYTDDDVIGANTISTFAVAADGSLSLVGAPVATGGGGAGGGGYAANRITIFKNFLFVANGGTGSISAFSIDPATGLLTAAGSPLATGAGWGDISLAVSSDGRFLFAGLGANDSIVVANIAADGSLSSSGFSAAVPAPPAGLKATPDGRFLSVALPAYGPGAVAMFGIASNGAVSMLNNGVPFFGSGSGNVVSLESDCAASHVFGGNMTSSNAAVNVFGISSAGLLSAIQGSPFSLGTGLNSSALVLSPNDRFLFIGNQGSKTITVSNVASDGTLSLAGGAAFPFGNTIPGGMSTDQGGALLFVGSSSSLSNLIYVFNIAADGSLTAVSGSPFNAGAQSGLLSLAAFPAKVCSTGQGGGPPPTPPVVSGMPAAGCTLWPPNSQMVPVATVAATAVAGLASFNVIGTSSEPSDPNNPDIVITGSVLQPRNIQLRAARMGSGSGRVYTLTATATDVAGNVTSSTATCNVPHDQAN